MYVLDTNIIRYSLYHPENYPYLVQKIISAKQHSLFISIITAQELIAWRLSEVTNSSNQKYPRIVQTYANLFQIINDVKKLQILPFDEEAYRKFLDIPATVRCTVNDKRIAATALANNFRVVTANTQDFENIPNLIVEDWTARPLE